MPEGRGFTALFVGGYAEDYYQTAAVRKRKEMNLSGGIRMEAASETEKKLVFIPKPSPPEKIVDAIDLLVYEEDTKGEMRQVNAVTAKLSIPRCDFATAQAGNLFFVAGGFDGTNCVDTIDVFNLDLATGTATDVSDHTNIKLDVAESKDPLDAFKPPTADIQKPKTQRGNKASKGEKKLSKASDHNDLAEVRSTVLEKIVKQALNNPNRVGSQKKGQITITIDPLTEDNIITYKGNDDAYSIRIERVKELFAKRVKNGVKIFNFLLQKLSEQEYQERTNFTLSELVDIGIYKNSDSAYKGLETVLNKFMNMSVEGSVSVYQEDKGKKQKKILSFKRREFVVTAHLITYSTCIVEMPQIIRNCSQFTTILPCWGYALKGENAYMLLDYIYYIARQNTKKIETNGYFTIRLDSVRQHLGLPAPEEVKKYNKRNYNKLIYEPINSAIEEIEEKQAGNSLKITPMYDPKFKNIHEYLDGYLEIKLGGTSFKYLKQLATGKTKHRPELPSAHSAPI
jgi:hypothetical protein